jgi:hypothetical protein
MNNIIYILVKYFDFKLTNVHYSYNTDIKKLNDIIIKLNSDDFEYLKILHKYFDHYTDQDDLIQCVNLIDFPNNFT